MLLIQDDPIVKDILLRGYPPWIKDDDYEPYDDEDSDDVYYGSETDCF